LRTSVATRSAFGPARPGPEKTAAQALQPRSRKTGRQRVGKFEILLLSLASSLLSLFSRSPLLFCGASSLFPLAACPLVARVEESRERVERPVRLQRVPNQFPSNARGLRENWFLGRPSLRPRPRQQHPRPSATGPLAVAAGPPVKAGAPVPRHPLRPCSLHNPPALRPRPTQSGPPGARASSGLFGDESRAVRPKFRLHRPGWRQE